MYSLKGKQIYIKYIYCDFVKGVIKLQGIDWRGLGAYTFYEKN